MYSDLNISINQCLKRNIETMPCQGLLTIHHFTTATINTLHPMPSKGKNLSCKVQENQICKDTELLQKSFSCGSLLFVWCWLVSTSWTESVPVPKNLVSKWQKDEKQEQCQWHKHSRCGKGHQGRVSCCSEDSECQGGSMWLFGGAKPPEWGTAHPPPRQSMERNPSPQPLIAPTGDGGVKCPWDLQAVPKNEELPPTAALLNICSSFCITKVMRVVWGQAVPPCIGEGG